MPPVAGFPVPLARPQGLMTAEDYIASVPDGPSDYVLHLATGPGMLLSGFLDWEPSEARRWGGPWEGGRVLASLKDCSAVGHGPLHAAAWARERIQGGIAKPPLPGRLAHRLDLRHDEAALMAEMTPAETAKWQRAAKVHADYVEHELAGTATLEAPFLLRLYGNDDCSWSRAYASAAEGYEALMLITEVPLFATLDELGFAFTN